MIGGSQPFSFDTKSAQIDKCVRDTSSR